MRVPEYHTSLPFAYRTLHPPASPKQATQEELKPENYHPWTSRHKKYKVSRNDGTQPTGILRTGRCETEQERTSERERYFAYQEKLNPLLEDVTDFSTLQEIMWRLYQKHYGSTNRKSHRTLIPSRRPTPTCRCLQNASHCLLLEHKERERMSAHRPSGPKKASMLP